jgi:hypothetical protein
MNKIVESHQRLRAQQNIKEIIDAVRGAHVHARSHMAGDAPEPQVLLLGTLGDK